MVQNNFVFRVTLPYLKTKYPGCRQNMVQNETIIFGTLEDGSLEINSLTLNTCFSYRNSFQNSVNALSKTVLKNLVFCQKAQDFM